jgi:hypothetical protein
MEPFTHTRYVPKAQEDYTLYEGGEGAARHDMWGGPSTVGEVEVKIVEEYVPAGELAVHPGLHVEATNGRIGIVEELIVDPASEQVTHGSVFMNVSITSAMALAVEEALAGYSGDEKTGALITLTVLVGL